HETFHQQLRISKRDSRRSPARYLMAEKWIPLNVDIVLADGVGFEPTRPLQACRFSRPVPSTARPPIRGPALARKPLTMQWDLAPACMERDLAMDYLGGVGDVRAGPSKWTRHEGFARSSRWPA